jgi:hypothetical protein
MGLHERWTGLIPVWVWCGRSLLAGRWALDGRSKDPDMQGVLSPGLSRRQLVPHGVLMCPKSSAHSVRLIQLSSPVSAPQFGSSPARPLASSWQWLRPAPHCPLLKRSGPFPLKPGEGPATRTGRIASRETPSPTSPDLSRQKGSKCFLSLRHGPSPLAAHDSKQRVCHQPIASGFRGDTAALYHSLGAAQVARITPHDGSYLEALQSSALSLRHPHCL